MIYLSSYVFKKMVKCYFTNNICMNRKIYFKIYWKIWHTKFSIFLSEWIISAEYSCWKKKACESWSSRGCIFRWIIDLQSEFLIAPAVRLLQRILLLDVREMCSPPLHFNIVPRAKEKIRKRISPGSLIYRTQ